MHKLIVEQETKENVLRIKLSGGVSEEAHLPELAFGGIETLVIDLEGIEYINSIGILEWVKWINNFPTSIHEGHLRVEKVKPIIIEQVKMFGNFFPPKTVVDSFFVNYYCDDTDEVELVFFERGKDFDVGQPPKIEEERVSKDGESNLVLDLDPGSFLSFL